MVGVDPKIFNCIIPREVKMWCKHMNPKECVQYPLSPCFKFCPECGTPRPEKKKLWEKIKKFHLQKNDGTYAFDPCQSADLAKEEFTKLVDEVTAEEWVGVDYKIQPLKLISEDKLKAKIKDM